MIRAVDKADAFQRSIISEAIYHLAATVWGGHGVNLEGGGRIPDDNDIVYDRVRGVI